MSWRYRKFPTLGMSEFPQENLKQCKTNKQTHNWVLRKNKSPPNYLENTAIHIIKHKDFFLTIKLAYETLYHTFYNLYQVWLQKTPACVLLNCNKYYLLWSQNTTYIIYQIYQIIHSPVETSEQLENMPVWKVQTSIDWFADWLKIVLLSSRLNCSKNALNLLKKKIQSFCI